MWRVAVRGGLAAIIAITGGLTNAHTANAACLTPDGIYVAYNGVGTESGTLWWNSYQRYSFDVTVSDVPNRRAGRLFVRAWRQGAGGYQTNEVFQIADGRSARFTRSNYYLPFQISKIGFGIIHEGARELDIAWDYNQPCGQ